MIGFITKDKYISLFLKEWLIIAVAMLPFSIYFGSWVLLPVISYYYAGIWHIIKNVLNRVEMTMNYVYSILLLRFMKVLFIQISILSIYYVIRNKGSLL